MKASSPDQRKLKGAETRERILEAATALISAHGYAATGVSEIARQAGVEKAALYWHFNSKETLLAEVIERIDAQWIEHIRERVSAADTSEDRLRRFIDGLKDLTTDYAHVLRLITHVALERSDVSPPTGEAVRRIFERTADVIAEEFKADLGFELPDIDLITRLSIAYLLEATIRKAVDPDHVDIDRLFNHLRRLIALDVGYQMERRDVTG